MPTPGARRQPGPGCVCFRGAGRRPHAPSRLLPSSPLPGPPPAHPACRARVPPSLGRIPSALCLFTDTPAPPPRHPLHPPALRDQPLTYTHAHRRAPPSPVSPGPPHRCPSAPLPPLRSSLSPSARSPHCPPAPPAVRPPPPHPARPPRQPGHPLHIRRPSTPARPGPTRVSSSKPLPSSAVSARGPCPRTYFHPKSIHPTTQRPTSRLFSSPNPPSFSAHGWAGRSGQALPLGYRSREVTASALEEPTWPSPGGLCSPAGRSHPTLNPRPGA